MGFELAKYDASKPVVIDPILEYGTYLGGAAGPSEALAVASDAAGAIYVAGRTYASDFPLVSPADSTGIGEGFVTKMNAAGTALSYSTFLGGGGSTDQVNGIAVGATDNAFVTGTTQSADFPIRNAVQPQTGGGFFEGFVARFGSGGNLVFSTYLGGSSIESMNSIAVNSDSVVVAGQSESPNFPGTPAQAQAYRGVIARYTLDGSARTFSKSVAQVNTFSRVALDSSGFAYLTGWTHTGQGFGTPGSYQPDNRGQEDAFVAKLTPSGDQWQYVTHTGARGNQFGTGIAVDALGRACISGWVPGGAVDFPVVNGISGSSSTLFPDGFLICVNPAGNALTLATLIGGAAEDVATGVAIDPAGFVILTGRTFSSDFPLSNSWLPALGTGAAATFVAKFAPGGTLSYSSLHPYLGHFAAITAGANGSILLAGTATGNDPWAVTPGAYDVTRNNQYSSDAYIARIVDGPGPVQVTIASVPAGRNILVDGRPIVTPAQVSWQPGSPHTLEVPTPQAGSGTQYRFTSWSGGSTAPIRNVIAASGATFQANFSSAACTYGFNPGSVTVGVTGSTFLVLKDAQEGCPSFPTSNATWVTLNSAYPTDTGSGSFRVRISPNPGGPRTGTVTLGNATLTVSQGGSQAPLAAPSINAPPSPIRTASYNLTWSGVGGAGGYEVYATKQDNVGEYYLNHFERRAGGSTTNSTLTMSDGDYNFYVRACSPAGFGDTNCGPYATVAAVANLNVPLNQPTIIFPGTGQTLTSSTNQYRWRPEVGATPTRYDVRIIVDNLFTPTTMLSILTPNTDTIFTLPSGDYKLIIAACIEKCGPAVLLEHKFKVRLPTLSSTAPSGLTASVSNGNTVNASWTAVTGADLYRVQVVQPNAGPGGGALTVAARQVSTTSISLPVPAGTATLVVNACNGDGCGPAATIPVSPTGPNRSLPLVATPMPVAVTDGPVVTISWSRIAGDNGSNTDYRLYVGDLSRDGPALDVITKNNFYGAYVRAEGRRYDALVFATQNGVTVQGPASGFMVAGTSVSGSLVTSPTHGSTFPQKPFRLAWSPVGLVPTVYQYYVVRVGQNAPVLTGVTAGLYVDTNLAVTSPTQFQAIVRACHYACTLESDAGWGPWSDTITGTTSFTITP